MSTSMRKMLGMRRPTTYSRGRRRISTWTGREQMTAQIWWRNNDPSIYVRRWIQPLWHCVCCLTANRSFFAWIYSFKKLLCVNRLKNLKELKQGDEKQNKPQNNWSSFDKTNLQWFSIIVCDLRCCSTNKTPFFSKLNVPPRPPAHLPWALRATSPLI